MKVEKGNRKFGYLSREDGTHARDEVAVCGIYPAVVPAVVLSLELSVPWPRWWVRFPTFLCCPFLARVCFDFLCEVSSGYAPDGEVLYVERLVRLWDPSILQSARAPTGVEMMSR